MKFKKLIALMLAFVLVLAGCGGNTQGNQGEKPAANEEKSATDKADDKKATEEKKPAEGKNEAATIVFWHAMNGKQEEALTKLADDFMKENTNIKVELQNQTGYQELQQKITATSTSPSDLPTMTQAYPDWMFNPIKDGLVHDLTNYTKQLKDYDDVLEGFRKGTQIDGKVYSIPFNKSTEVLWYNEDMLNELGIEVPKTYDELKVAAQKIYKEKGIPGAGWDSLSNYYTTFITAEGKAFSKDFDVNSEESKKAVNYYLDGVKEGYFRIAGTDKYMSGPFGNEQVAMYIGSNAGESFVLQSAAGKFTTKAAPAPTGVAIQQGTDVYVFEKATDAEKEAAYKFLTFITSKEAQIEWGIATGYIPARKSSIESDEYKNSGSLIGPIISDATKNLYTNPVQGGANQAYREAGTMLETVLGTPNDANVDKILADFQGVLEGIWE